MPWPINPTDVANKLPHFPAAWTGPLDDQRLNALAGILGKTKPFGKLTNEQYATILPVLGAMLAAGALNEGHPSAFSVGLPSDGALGLNLTYRKDF